MIIKQNKKSTLGTVILLAVVIAIFVLGIVMFNSPRIDDEDKGFAVLFTVFAVPCVILILATLIWFIKELFSDKILIEIDDEALTDNSSAISLGRIPWADMEYAYLKGTYLVIRLKHPAKYVERKGAIVRFLIRMSVRMGYDAVCISPVRFRHQGKEFFEKFKERIPILTPEQLYLAQLAEKNKNSKEN